MRLLFSVTLYSIILLSGRPLKAQTGKDYRNVVYKVAGGDSLMLDIFLPQDKPSLTTVPVVLIIHGCAWVEGNRELESIYYMRQLKQQLNNNGIAAISIDYRLVDKTTNLPAPVVDCKDAVRWVKAHAAAYHLDAGRIGLWGGSAGAHLALLTAYTPDSLWTGDKDLSTYSAGVNYVVDNFGPTDLNQLLQTDAGKFKLFLARIFIKKLLPLRERLLFALTGLPTIAYQQQVTNALAPYAPLKYINATTAPTIIFHGTKDKVVPLQQSKQLHRSLDAAHVANELIIVKKGDHGFNNISKEAIDALVDQVVAYVMLQNRC